MEDLNSRYKQRKAESSGMGFLANVSILYKVEPVLILANDKPLKRNTKE